MENKFLKPLRVESLHKVSFHSGKKITLENKKEIFGQKASRSISVGERQTWGKSFCRILKEEKVVKIEN